MKFTPSLLAISLAAGISASSVFDEDAFLAGLIRRQELGTPKGNCHDNCGTAITATKTPTFSCKSPSFITNYNNCLQCAGPDNHNIWRYYGATLKVAGAKCGFNTEPKSGKQEDVPEAVKGDAPVVGSTTSATSATNAAVSVSSTAALSSVHESSSSSVAVVGSPAPASASASASATHIAAVPTITSPTASTASTNGTVATPTVAVQTTNAGVSKFGTGGFGLGSVLGVVLLVRLWA